MIKGTVKVVAILAVAGLLWSLTTVKKAREKDKNRLVQDAQVERIIDGDTIDVRLADGKKLRVRVLGLDCPESRRNKKCKRDEEKGFKGCEWQIPRGKQATKEARSILESTDIKIECGRICRDDRYQRALRYIRLKDGRDFGLEMIKRGLCRDSPYFHLRTDTYKKAGAQS